MKNCKKRLPKYVGGKLALGYQDNSNYFNPYSSINTPLQDAQSDAATLKSMYAPNLLQQSTSIMNTMTNAGLTKLYPTWSKAGQKVAEEAAKKAAENGTKSAATGLLGNAMGVLGTAYGAYNFANALGDYKNAVSTNDLQNYSTTSNNVLADGTSYQTYDGYNNNAIDNITHSQNVNSAINTIGSGAGLGASVGSIIPGLGTALGAGIGAVIGGVAHVIGAGDRNRKVNDAKKQYSMFVNNYNRQSESEGISKMMRAYKGMPQNSDLSTIVKSNKAKDITGQNTGLQNAWADYGEVQYDPMTGDARIITEGKGKKDGAPVLTNENEAILGNKYIPGTKTTYAQAARKAALRGDKDMLDALTASQNNNVNNMKVLASTNKNKLPRRYEGQTTDLLNFGIPALLGSVNAMQMYNQYKNAKPTATNTFVPNQMATKALSMMPEDYDVTNQLRAVNDTGRKALYNYNMSSLPSGLKAALQSQLYNDMMTKTAGIYDTQSQMRNQLRGQKAEMMYKIGEAEAAREQQSKAAYAQQLAQAYATRLKGMETARQSGMQNIYDFAHNIYNANWANRNIGLYREELDLKKKQLEAQYPSVAKNKTEAKNEPAKTTVKKVSNFDHNSFNYKPMKRFDYKPWQEGILDYIPTFNYNKTPAAPIDWTNHIFGEFGIRH